MTLQTRVIAALGNALFRCCMISGIDATVFEKFKVTRSVVIYTTSSGKWGKRRK